MNDKRAHISGNGQQVAQRPSPFIYLQPRLQPYHFYQHWQLNSLYPYYGFPGGYSVRRPLMLPYPHQQYVQFPGYLLPHAPTYPVDFRQMFETRLHAPAWSDVPRQQCHLQPRGRREMSPSDAQSDSSDDIMELIQSMNKMRANELQGSEQQLCVGVAPSRMFSPGGERRNEDQGAASDDVESSAVTFTDSTTTEDDGETRQMIVDNLSPEGNLSGGQEEKVLVLNGDKTSSKISKTEHQTAFFDDAKSDPSHQIFRLPFDRVFTPGSPGAPGGPRAAGASGHISFLESPCYYVHLSMEASQERMNAFNPSLHASYSHHEMFYEDLKDPPVYTGRRLTDVLSGSPQSSEMWQSDSKSLVCNCHGNGLAKLRDGCKVHSLKGYRDESEDSEEECTYGRQYTEPVRVVVREPFTHRKSQPVPLRHVANPLYNRSQYRDLLDTVEQKEGHHISKKAPTAGDTGDVTGSVLQCRTCQGPAKRREPRC